MKGPALEDQKKDGRNVAKPEQNVKKSKGFVCGNNHFDVAVAAWVGVFHCMPTNQGMLVVSTGRRLTL